MTITGASEAVRKSLQGHGVVPPLADYRETIADAVAAAKVRIAGSAAAKVRIAGSATA